MLTWRFVTALTQVFPEGVQRLHLALLLIPNPHHRGLNHQFSPHPPPAWWLHHVSTAAKGIVNLAFRRSGVGFGLPCEFVHFVSLAWTSVDGLWLDLRFEIEFLWTPSGARKRMEWQRACWSLTPAHWWLLSSLLVVALNKTALSLSIVDLPPSQSLQDLPL